MSTEIEAEAMADRIEEVTLSSGKKYKIKAVSLETGFDWLDIEDKAKNDRKALIDAKMKFFVAEPKIPDNASSKMSMGEGIELIRHINQLNGMGDFTQSQENSQEPKDGKDTTK